MKFSSSPQGRITMKYFQSAIFIVALSVFSVFPAFAQETEAVVIDEVVAQINDGVLTLSRVRREMKEIIETMVQQGKTREAATTEINGKQGELIASLITEELLLQRAKEEGVDKSAESEINQRFVQMMKENNLKTIDALNTFIKAQGFNPEQIREDWRRQISKDLVLQQQVDQKEYWDPTTKQLRDYWEKNKEKFKKPEMVTLSTIFLNFAGRDEAAVREKAKKLVADIRNGAEFEKTVLENSDDPQVSQNKGKVGKFNVAELNDKISGPIKATKAGNVTEPIELDGGIQIIRVDERIEASDEAYFDEEAVRRALAVEKIPAARKKFMTELKRDSFIKISETYKASVLPHLEKEETTAEVKKTDE